MKYYIIAGEASGDLHGSNLIKALRQEDPAGEFRVWGGDLMEAAGGVLVKHYRDLAFMGFWEVVANLRTILNNISFCKEDIRHFQPDVLILIDYPGFNLRMAKWARPAGFKVFYYISPQLWAWHSSRVHQIKANVDRMFVILPFEEEFYQGYNFPVDFVGHPLLDVIDQRPPTPGFRKDHQLDDRPIIALLPGSRRQEISRMLSVMLETVSRFPEFQFAIAGAPSIPDEVYTSIIAQTATRQPVSKAALTEVKLIRNQTYDLLANAYAAAVTSGTATLEAGLFRVPQVVCYRGSRISYYIARRLVNVSYISLVNLIMEEPLVEELIQDDFRPSRLAEEIRRLSAPSIRDQMLKGYDTLRKKLGHSGASARAARLMTTYLSEDKQT